MRWFHLYSCFISTLNTESSQNLKKNVINYDVIVEITSCVPQTSSLLLSHEYLSMFRAFDVVVRSSTKTK